MGTKHGIWFDLSTHIAIHKKVIQDFNWLISSGQHEYTITRFKDKKDYEILKFSIEFETTNGFDVKITKETRISKDDSSLAMTSDFSYNCLGKSDNSHLRYHNRHDEDYLVEVPWHNKPHRHSFDGTTQRISVYSHDHRPEKHKFKKYKWKAYQVELKFLDQEDWPFVKEFLEEVSQL